MVAWIVTVGTGGCSLDRSPSGGTTDASVPPDALVVRVDSGPAVDEDAPTPPPDDSGVVPPIDTGIAPGFDAGTSVERDAGPISPGCRVADETTVECDCGRGSACDFSCAGSCRTVCEMHTYCTMVCTGACEIEMACGSMSTCVLSCGGGASSCRCPESTSCIMRCSASGICSSVP